MAVSILAILSVIPIVLLVLILGIIFSVRVRTKDSDSSYNEKGGKRMIKTVYTYLILFATLMMTIGGSVAAFMAVADIVSPPGYYMSYEDYKRSNGKLDVEANEKENGAQTIVKNEEEIKKEYEAMVSEEKTRSRERATNSLIKSFGWIVIPFPIFVYYQRRLRQD